MTCVSGKSIKCLVQEKGVGAVVYRGHIMAKCIDLCEIMQYEFIFTKTCQSLEVALSEVMDTFISSEILIPQQVSIAILNFLSSKLKLIDKQQ